MKDDSRCVGWAIRKGRKCQAHISFDNSSMVNRLIESISKLQPDLTQIRFKLHRLAGYTLCARHHSHQLANVLTKWEERVRNAFPDVQTIPSPPWAPQRLTHSLSTRSIRPQAPTPPLNSHSFTPMPASTLGPALASYLPALTELEALQQIIRIAQQRIRTIMVRSGSLSTSRVPSAAPWMTEPDSAYQSEIDDDEDHVIEEARRVEYIDHTTLMDTQSYVDIVEYERNAEYPVRPESPPTPRALSHIPTAEISSLTLSGSATYTYGPPYSTAMTPHLIIIPPTPCFRTHVYRRTLDEECAICQGDALMSTVPLSQLAWCKSTCGRSVHRECFALWQHECWLDDRDASCIYCRSRWEEECDNCECDTQVPREIID